MVDHEMEVSPSASAKQKDEECGGGGFGGRVQLRQDRAP